MFSSTGTLQYSENPYRLIVSIDPQLAKYYLYQANKMAHLGLNGQRWAPHISVIRKEVPTNLLFWRQHEGLTVEFEYDPCVKNCATYYWVNVYSKQLEFIRKELGLRDKTLFHFTIGNVKELAQ